MNGDEKVVIEPHIYNALLSLTDYAEARHRNKIIEESIGKYLKEAEKYKNNEKRQKVEQDLAESINNEGCKTYQRCVIRTDLELVDRMKDLERIVNRDSSYHGRINHSVIANLALRKYLKEKGEL